MSQRALPSSISAERSVLGAVLLKPEVLDRVDLTAESFYDPRNKTLWTACRNLRASEVAIDVRTLEAELERMERLQVIGGLSYLSQVAVEVPTADNVEHYAEIVRQRAKAREVMAAASAIVEAGYDGEGDGDELLARLSAASRAIRPNRRLDALSARQLAERRIKQLLQAAEDAAKGRTPPRLPTGLPALDLHTGGLPRGNLTALIARPGDGKTAVATHMATHVPCPALVYVYEERDRDMVDRQLAARSGIAAIDIASGRLERDDFQRLIAAGNQMPCDVYFVAARGMTDEDVVRSARQLVPELGVGLVVVDYLNRMRWSASPRLRTDERIRHALDLQDDAAGELDVAWLVAAQVGRAAAKENRPARIDDARDSGAIEEIAKLGLVVHRPYKHRPLKPKDESTHKGERYEDDEIDIIIDKQNLGRSYKVCRFDWDGPTMTISSRAVEAPADPREPRDLFDQEKPF